MRFIWICLPLFLFCWKAQSVASTCLSSRDSLADLKDLTKNLNPCHENPKKMKVATYNILNRNVKKSLHKYLPWPERSPLIAEWVKQNKLDILGTQEGITDMIEDLKKNLPEYQVLGRPRTDSPIDGEYSAIFVNKQRFEVLNSGDFWLSKTPDVPASKNWDSTVPRICTWAELKDKVTGEKIFVFNAHFDHLGSMARTKSAQMIMERIKQLGPSAKVLVMGDFNAKEEDSELEAFRNHLSESRGSSLSRPRGQPRSIFYGIIDHIYSTPGMVTCQYEIMNPRASDGRRLSDHSPVVIEMAP